MVDCDLVLLMLTFSVRRILDQSGSYIGSAPGTLIGDASRFLICPRLIRAISESSSAGQETLIDN
jgi:hypothetical protein